MTKRYRVGNAVGQPPNGRDYLVRYRNFLRQHASRNGGIRERSSTIGQTGGSAPHCRGRPNRRIPTHCEMSGAWTTLSHDGHTGLFSDFTLFRPVIESLAEIIWTLGAGEPK